MRYEYDDFALGRGYTQEFELSYPSLGLERRCRAEKRTVHNGEKGGRLERVTFPTVEGIAGGVVEYRYDDPSGLLLEVHFNGKPVWSADPTRINARGQAVEVRLGNGTVTRFDYAPADGRLRGYEVVAGQRTLLRGALAYDTGGNLRARQILSARPGAEDAPAAWEGEYEYDDRSQLLRARETRHEEAYEYRENGSRQRFHDPRGTTEYAYEGRSPHQVTRLTGAYRRTLAYDSAGNLIRDENHDTKILRALDWNAGNRLREMRFTDAAQKPLRTLAFGYGGSAERLFHYDSARDALVYYVDDDFEVEWSDGGRRAIIRTHIENGARRIATVIQERGRDPVVVYYYRDHVYSAALLADGEGRVTYAVRYTPFGAVLEEAGTNPTGIGFGGKRTDVVAFHGFSSYDNRARVYDPDLGIFLSPDPMQDTKGVAFGMNRYLYCGNNPLSRTDPSGFDQEYWKTRVVYADKATYDFDKSTGFLDKINDIAKRHTGEPVHIGWGKSLKKIPPTMHIYFPQEADYFTPKSAEKMAKIGETLGAQHLSMGHCGATAADRKLLQTELQKLDWSAEVHSVPAASRKVFVSRTTSVHGKSTPGQPLELVHGPTHPSVNIDSEHKKLVDLNAPLQGESPFTNKFTKGKIEPRIVDGAPKLQGYGKTGKQVLRGLGPIGRVVDFGMTAMDIAKGNVAELAESAASAALATAATATAAVAFGAGALGAVAFTAGSLIGTGIHYVTGGYVANKAADALVSMGAHHVLNAAQDVVNKAKAWFSSWW
jgi:RHS repeat-associated protein